MDSSILLRRAILLQLEAAYPASLCIETILDGVRACGLPCSEGELYADIDYLQQKGMLIKTHSPISASHVRAKLAAKGLDYLEGGEF